MKSLHPLIKLLVLSAVIVLGGMEIYDRLAYASFGNAPSNTTATRSIDTMGMVGQPMPLFPEFIEFEETVRRPLFVPERRSALMAELQTEVDIAPDVLMLQYIGSLDDGRATVALVKHDGVLLRMATGDEIEGWHVVSIEGRRITFRRAGELRQFLMFER